MIRTVFAVTAFCLGIVTSAYAQVVVRDFATVAVVPAAEGATHPELQLEQHEDAERLRPRADVWVDGAYRQPSMLAVYPVAGQTGRDIAIPFYVDVDPGGAGRDFNCGRLAFGGHKGHDPYIRSFKEQAIGVPVFAARDGVVHAVRDGQPDENVTDDPSFLSNYVFLRHGTDELTQYVHLKKDSITVQVGQFVTAGTQIGMVGSSGPSRAPHIHFEARMLNVAFEPMAGPCRPGKSFFIDQPEAVGAMMLGASFSHQSFADFRPAPFDDAPHTGTFVAGNQKIYFKADMANVSASTKYRLLLQPPGGSASALASSGTLFSYDAALAAVWWGIDVNLDRTGTWNVVLEVENGPTFTLPFTVVSSQAAVVNRPPNAISAEIGPTNLAAAQVPVCRAVSSSIPDPDYDVVRYRYEWRVEGDVVRDVTTAATTDALPRQYTRARANISCSITASDGTAEAQTVSAHVTVQDTRRRSVGR
jgi:murein DD-endopeptidase MepM/ murein hydrolase activator NlpD